MRAKRSIYNLIFGLLNQLIIIAFGIVIPRLLLVNFGSEMNGLLSSIGQVFMYLALLEAGVGGASIQALYKLNANDDKFEVNSVLAATSKYYQKTGIYYFIAVIAFSLIYPFIISTDISKMDVIFIILLTGMNGVINYFFQGKYRILLTAENKNYVNSLIDTIMTILSNSIKITLLLFGYNIILIQASYLIISLFKVLIIQGYIRKNYEWINLQVKPNYDAISQKNSVLLHQISYFVFANTDVLILTIFCGLKTVSVYVMYNMIFSMVDNVVLILNNSISAALGQTYYESKEKYIKYYDIYELYYMAIVFSLFLITYILVLPFMNLYTMGITDINYMNSVLPILFVISKILTNARIPGEYAIKAAGDFKATQNKALLEAVINISCSLFFVNLYGIYGVLLGTIIALLYRSIDIIIYSNKKIICRSPWISIKRWIVDLIIFSMGVLITNRIEISANSYIDLIYKGIILTIIILPAYFIIVSLFERAIYKSTIILLNNYLKEFIYKRKTITHKKIFQQKN